jgi:formylmethanofuran dehydrogenase subunit A
MRNSKLKDLTREFSLGEIAIVTRAGPARVLGLSHKGHLGAGADADITVYHDRPADPQAMFESPRYVMKGGRVLVEDGELRTSVRGGKFCAAIDPDERGAAVLKDWFDGHGSYSVRQFGLHDSERAALRAVGGR